MVTVCPSNINIEQHSKESNGATDTWTRASGSQKMCSHDDSHVTRTNECSVCHMSYDHNDSRRPPLPPPPPWTGAFCSAERSGFTWKSLRDLMMWVPTRGKRPKFLLSKIRMLRGGAYSSSLGKHCRIISRIKSPSFKGILL